MKKIKRINIRKSALFCWILIFIISGIGSVNAFYIRKKNNEIETLITDSIQLIQAGYVYKNTLIKLTIAARNFSMTLSAQSLKSYWDEIKIKKSILLMIELAKKHNIKKNELRLLLNSSLEYEKVADENIRSMFLIMHAYKLPVKLYPTSLSSYRLSTTELKMKPSKLVRLAQKILFNENYNYLFSNAISPLNQYNQDIISTLWNKKELLYSNIRFLTFFEFIFMIIIFITIMSLVWLRTMGEN